MKNKEQSTFTMAEIIARSITGELTAEEERQLQEWLDESERNREEYINFRNTGRLLHEMQKAKAIDWKTDYKSFMNKHRIGQPKASIRKWLRYAAVAIVFITCGIAVYFHTSKIPTEQYAGQDIVPIRKQALLILAEGEQMILSDTLSPCLQRQGNVEIEIKNDRLAYSVNKGKPAEADKVMYNVLKTPRGGEYMLMLSDGTKVWLNAESEIRYPARFTGKERTVFVQGEAFFDVKRDTAHPFKVLTGNAGVTVLGTEFNFRAYPEEDAVVATLVSGSVILETKRQNQETRLQPGEQGRVDKESGLLSKTKVNTYLYTAWQEGRIVFRDTRLEDLFTNLARWYDLEVFYLHEEAKDIRFTGDIDKTESFEKILHIIEQNERVAFTVNKNTVSIYLK